MTSAAVVVGRMASSTDACFAAAISATGQALDVGGARLAFGARLVVVVNADAA
ncbi:MAG: hypothetical protein JXB32_12125 [Deltaproteobacteria bacterium]|nr:hypothetical protein [Deltaproteobacteria bacterium]